MEKSHLLLFCAAVLLDSALGVLPKSAASTWGGDVNILFLMCDSMDGRVVDPASPVSKRMRTPFFDSLAQEGVNFVNTYAASPQCVPSRTTMLSGGVQTKLVRGLTGKVSLCLRVASSMQRV